MRVLRPAKAAEMLGVSKATLWRWSRTVEDFPIAFQIGPNAIGFDEQELADFLKSRRSLPKAKTAATASI